MQYNIIEYNMIKYNIRRPPCGAHGCEGHHCPQSLSTVTSQQTVSYSHCPLYCTPPLMVPRQTRTPQNTTNPEVAPNWLGAFRCTGVMRERQKPRKIGKRKPRASVAPKHGKTQCESVRSAETLENVSPERRWRPNNRKRNAGASEAKP